MRAVRGLAAVAVSLVVAGAAAASGSADSSPLSPRYPTTVDVRYAGDDDPAHRLDLYLPEGQAGPFPLVIFVHGGAWSYGDKAMPPLSSYGTFRRVLAERGYAVASVQYRFVDKAPFPAQLHDVKAAVRYLRANAAALRVDPDRFAIAGDSAGGQLAQLVGLTGAASAAEPTQPAQAAQPAQPAQAPEGADLEGAVGTTGVSSAVRAVVSYYGVADLVRLFGDRAAANCRSFRARGPATAEGRLVRGDPESGAGRERALAASPVTYAVASRTPMLLFHGSADCVVPAAQSERLAQELTSAGGVAQLRIVPGAGHSAPVFYQDVQLQRELLGFLDRYVRG